MSGMGKERPGLGDLAGQVLDLVHAAVGSAGGGRGRRRRHRPGADPVRQLVHPPERRRRRPSRSGCDCTVDGRTATGSTTVTDADGLTQLVDRTVAATRLSPTGPAVAGTGAAVSGRLERPASTRTRPTPSPAPGRNGCGRFVDRRRGARDGRILQHRCGGRWPSPTRPGRRLRPRRPVRRWTRSLASGRPTDVARLAVPRLADLDGAVLGRACGREGAGRGRSGRATARPVRGRARADRRRRPAVNMALYGFNGKARRRSGAPSWSWARVSSTRRSRSWTIRIGAGGLGLPFDVEGTPTPRLHPCRRGSHERRRARPSHCADRPAPSQPDTRYPAEPPGARFRRTCTSCRANGSAGHGAAARGEAAGPAADAAVAELVAQVGRGLLVTDNWYTRVLDPRTLVVTGLTRNGVWLIEYG